MVDGRLIAAYRTLYECAVAAGQPVQQAGGSGSGVADLGSSWQHHMRIAVGLRCRELLRGMATPLLDDLQRLTAWEQQTGELQHCWAAAQQHYSAAVAAFERQHGSVLGESGSSAVNAAIAKAAPSSSSSSSEAPLVDAGAAAGEDAALARTLLRQAAASAQAAKGETDGGAGSNNGGSGGASILPVQFRAYKKMILTDAILLSAE